MHGGRQGRYIRTLPLLTRRPEGPTVLRSETPNSMTRAELRKASPLSRCVLVSAHAVDRWYERIQPHSTDDRNTVVSKVLRLLEDAVPVSDTLFYASGVLLALNGNVVSSVYRPETKRQKSRVRKVLHNLRSAFPKALRPLPR